MGSTSYSLDARSLRADTLGYHTKTVDQIFTQSKKREVHELMNPKGLKVREAFDSVVHPETVPIILGLDVTGSMGKIPHDLVKDGLPKMMGNMIQKGLKDPALCFVGIGDHTVDDGPLQVGQFESGDEELDLWLTRTWLEGGGGGNDGESYLLAWYFAAFHTHIHSFEKRGRKGYLFTVGDEPNLRTLQGSAIRELVGAPFETMSAEQLLRKAQEKWKVYHLNVMQGSQGRNSLRGWKETLGDNCIQVDDYREISNIVADIVLEGEKDTSYTHPVVIGSDSYGDEPDKLRL